jgi:hypothetical protein
MNDQINVFTTEELQEIETAISKNKPYSGPSIKIAGFITGIALIGALFGAYGFESCCCSFICPWIPLVGVVVIVGIEVATTVINCKMVKEYLRNEKLI